eukprot:m.87666 g.87666  ORF g.87666 m.87666 type:complete len:505 (+) comp9716_c0_seq3:169-1683(+)
MDTASEYDVRTEQMRTLAFAAILVVMCVVFRLMDPVAAAYGKKPSEDNVAVASSTWLVDAVQSSRRVIATIQRSGWVEKRSWLTGGRPEQVTEDDMDEIESEWPDERNARSLEKCDLLLANRLKQLEVARNIIEDIRILSKEPTLRPAAVTGQRRASGSALFMSPKELSVARMLAECQTARTFVETLKQQLRHPDGTLDVASAELRIGGVFSALSHELEKEFTERKVRFKRYLDGLRRQEEDDAKWADEAQQTFTKLSQDKRASAQKFNGHVSSLAALANGESRIIQDRLHAAAERCVHWYAKVMDFVFLLALVVAVVAVTCVDFSHTRDGDATDNDPPVSDFYPSLDNVRWILGPLQGPVTLLSEVSDLITSFRSVGHLSYHGVPIVATLLTAFKLVTTGAMWAAVFVICASFYILYSDQVRLMSSRNQLEIILLAAFLALPFAWARLLRWWILRQVKRGITPAADCDNVQPSKWLRGATVAVAATAWGGTGIIAYRISTSLL